MDAFAACVKGNPLLRATSDRVCSWLEVMHGHNSLHMCVYIGATARAVEYMPLLLHYMVFSILLNGLLGTMVVVYPSI